MRVGVKALVEVVASKQCTTLRPLRYVFANAALFGQDQFSLARPSQPIDLAVVFDPDLFAAAGESVEFDDFWEVVRVRSC